jgi:hypothetical protein
VTTRRQTGPPRPHSTWDTPALLVATGVLAVLLAASLVRLVLV